MATTDGLDKLKLSYQLHTLMFLGINMPFIMIKTSFKIRKMSDIKNYAYNSLDSNISDMHRHVKKRLWNQCLNHVFGWQLKIRALVSNVQKSCCHAFLNFQNMPHRAHIDFVDSAQLQQQSLCKKYHGCHRLMIFQMCVFQIFSKICKFAHQYDTNLRKTTIFFIYMSPFRILQHEQGQSVTPTLMRCTAKLI